MMSLGFYTQHSSKDVASLGRGGAPKNHHLKIKNYHVLMHFSIFRLNISPRGSYRPPSPLQYLVWLS